MTSKRINNDLYNFLNKILEGDQMGFYSKKSMRFDEIYKAGVAFLDINGVKLEASDPLVIASQPPAPNKRK